MVDSHAVKMTPGASTLYVAGWMGDDPETGKIVPGGIEAQTVSLSVSFLRSSKLY